MKRFNLTSSMSDRENFNEMIRRDAEGMLETLPFNAGTEDDAWLQDGSQHAQAAFENFMFVAIEQVQVDENEGYGDYSNSVDDMEEAKAAYMTVFPQAVRDWQKSQMMDYLAEEMFVSDGPGYVGMITVAPGGQKDGLAFNPVVIDIVGLEYGGNQVAYRRSDDGHDDDWQIGGIQDAVEEALSQRQALKDIGKELLQDQEHAEEAAPIIGLDAVG